MSDRPQFGMAPYWIWLAILIAPTAVPGGIAAIAGWLMEASGCVPTFKVSSGCGPVLEGIFGLSFIITGLTLYITIVGVPIWLATLILRYTAWRYDMAKLAKDKK